MTVKFHISIKLLKHMTYSKDHIILNAAESRGMQVRVIPSNKQKQSRDSSCNIPSPSASSYGNVL